MRANQNPGRWRSAPRGFSLLEVIAAMVIFSAGATVLFSWIGQTATRLRTVGSEQRQLFGQLAALEFARILNPMLRPSGELAMDSSRVVWKSVAVGPESPVRTLTGAAGLYVVQLYQIELVVDQGKLGSSTQSLYLAGWRQVRKTQSSNPFSN